MRERDVVEKLADVWTTRDLPVLTEVARRVDSGDTHPSPTAVAASLDMPVEQVKLAAAALKRRGLVDTWDSMGGPQAFTALSGRAYGITGLHPDSDDVAERFVQALKQAADRVDDEDDASTLRKIARQVGSVSTDVIGAVLGSVVTKASGLG